MAKKAEIPDFYLTGVDGKQTQTSELSPIDEFVGSLGTNDPKPVDITQQVQDIFAPQSQPQTSTGQFLDTLNPGGAQRREEEWKQAAIRDFMQTGGVSQPGAAPQPGETPRQGSTIPSRDATGIPQSPSAGPSQLDSIAAQVAEVANKMGLKGDERESFMREQTQSINIQEVKAGIASKRLIKSIAEETGKTREEIGKEIGWTEGSGMSKIKALAGLKNLQKKNEIARADTGERASTRDAAISGASFDEGEGGERIPKNEEARAVLAYERMDDLGPDPQSDQSLYDSMTKSQKNQADRATKSLSKGLKISSGEEKRFNAMLDKVEKARLRTFQKKQADLKAAEIADAKRIAEGKVKTAEDKKLLGIQGKELDVLNDRRDEIIAKDGDLAEIDRQIDAKLLEMRGGQPATPPGEQIPEQFTFATIEEFNAANVPPGTRVSVGGKTATAN